MILGEGQVIPPNHPKPKYILGQNQFDQIGIFDALDEI